MSVQPSIAARVMAQRDAQKARAEAAEAAHRMCHVTEAKLLAHVERVERENAELRAAVERMRPVFDAALALRAAERRNNPLPPGTTKEGLLAMVAAFSPIRDAFDAAVDICAAGAEADRGD